MGTNYYLLVDICEKCGRPTKAYRIGKVSAGWKFLFVKQKGLEKFEDLPSFLAQGRIFDEYGREITVDELLRKIEAHQNQESSPSSDDIEKIGGYEFQLEEPSPKYPYYFL